MRTERELNIFQRNNRSREGENPASRISFNHAGESHVHAVTKVRIQVTFSQMASYFIPN